MRVLNTLDPTRGERTLLLGQCLEEFPRWVVSLPERPARMAQLLDGFDMATLSTTKDRVDEVGREVARRAAWQRLGVRPAWYVEGVRIADQLPSDYGLMVFHEYLSYVASVFTQEYDLQWELTDQPGQPWDLQPRVVGTPHVTTASAAPGVTRLGRGQQVGVYEGIAGAIEMYVLRGEPWPPLGFGRKYRPALLSPQPGLAPRVAKFSPIDLSVEVLSDDEREDELPEGFEHFNAVLTISEINIAERRLTEKRVAELVRSHADVLDTHVDTQEEVWLRLTDRALREIPRVTLALTDLLEKDAASS